MCGLLKSSVCLRMILIAAFSSRQDRSLFVLMAGLRYRNSLARGRSVHLMSMESISRSWLEPGKSSHLYGLDGTSNFYRLRGSEAATSQYWYDRGRVQYQIDIAGGQQLVGKCSRWSF